MLPAVPNSVTGGIAQNQRTTSYKKLVVLLIVSICEPNTVIELEAKIRSLLTVDSRTQCGSCFTIFKRTTTVALLVAAVITYSSYSKAPSSQPKAVSEMAVPPFEMFLTSSYYYTQSKSLGDNAVAIVVAGDYSAAFLSTIGILASNATHNTTHTFQIYKIGPAFCRWVPLMITGNTIPNMERLSIVLGTRSQNIPFRHPVSKKHDVVTCVAPLFANEQWQYSLFAAHTYRSYVSSFNPVFGTHMHMYIRSMMTPIFEMLKVYEKEGYLTIQPWQRMRLKTIDEAEFNPNVNVEFRNQAAAQTDCLLQYKESAQFIAFMDLDDILIPRMGSTYLEEFSYFFETTPNVAFIHYGKHNVDVKAHHNPADFSLAQMYSSIRFNQKAETGKSVTKPEFVNTTWIHWPMDLPAGLHRYDVPVSLNAIAHLKFMETDSDKPDNRTVKAPIYQPRHVPHNIFNVLLKKADIRWIQIDFQRMQRLPSIQSLWNFMPQNQFYFKLILKCYNDIYYRYHYSGQSSKITCPGPERCNFPKAPGLNCTNSIASYHSTEKNTRINIHFMTNEHFRVEDGCQP